MADSVPKSRGRGRKRKAASSQSETDDCRHVEIFIKAIVADLSVFAQLRQCLNSKLKENRVQDNFCVVNVFFESVATCTPSLPQLHTSKQSSRNGSSQKVRVDEEEYVRVNVVFYNSIGGDGNTDKFIKAVKTALACVKENEQTKWNVWLDIKHTPVPIECTTDEENKITFFREESQLDPTPALPYSVQFQDLRGTLQVVVSDENLQLK